MGLDILNNFNASLGGLAALTRFSGIGSMSDNNIRYSKERKQNKNAQKLEEAEESQAYMELSKALNDPTLSSAERNKARDNYTDIATKNAEAQVERNKQIATETGKAKDIDEALDAIAGKSQTESDIQNFNDAVYKQNVMSENIDPTMSAKKARLTQTIDETRSALKNANLSNLTVTDTRNAQPSARESFSPRQRATQMLQDEVNNRQLQRAGNRWLLDNLRDRMGGKK